MTALFQLLSAALLATLCHLLAVALCARALGIRVEHLRLGLGPAAGKSGLFGLGLLPLGGHVRMKMSWDDEYGGTIGAFDAQPQWKRLLVPLAGVAALLVLGLLAGGSAAGGQFVRGFSQAVGGALSPFETGQALLDRLLDYPREHAWLAVFGLVASKLAAMNLLPTLGSNGGAVLKDLVQRDAWHLRQDGPLQWLLLLATLLLCGGWLLALAARLF